MYGIVLERGYALESISAIQANASESVILSFFKRIFPQKKGLAVK